MLALRRGLAMRQLTRACSFQAKVKEMEAAAAKLAPSLPDDLKGIAAQGVRQRSCPAHDLLSRCASPPLHQHCDSVSTQRGGAIRDPPARATACVPNPSLPRASRTHGCPLVLHSRASRPSSPSLPVSVRSCTRPSWLLWRRRAPAS